MIHLVTNDEIDTFQAFCLSDPFGCKLSSLITAYGTQERFAEFWMCREENGNILSAIGRLESCITICAPKGINAETKLFVKMLPGISCIEAASVEDSDGIIMKCTEKPSSYNTARIDDGIYTIYQILSACNPQFATADMGAVYVDIHRRIQCKVMKTALVSENGQPCACAVASLSGDSALISSVACMPEKRNKGFAGAAIRGLLSVIPREHIYLFCKDTMKPYYHRFGFKAIGGYFENEQSLF